MKRALAILIFIIAGILVGYFFAFTKTQNRPLGFHYSAMAQKDFFEDAFKISRISSSPSMPNRSEEASISRPKGATLLAPKPADKKAIKGVVVNHHLLAAHFVAGAFNAVATNEPKTVVLISPNHFYRGRGNAISSLFDWKTPYGIIKPDKTLIRKLAEEKIVSIDESPFKEEHGISNLVAFFKKTLPSAKIIPIIIKDSLPPEQADELAQKLAKILPEKSLVIASLDFSHEVTSEVADAQDAQSLKILQNFDYNSAVNAHVDSKPSLRILLKYSLLRGAKEFRLLKMSNSSKLLKQNRNDTTSYITGYFL